MRVQHDVPIGALGNRIRGAYVVHTSAAPTILYSRRCGNLLNRANGGIAVVLGKTPGYP